MINAPITPGTPERSPDGTGEAASAKEGIIITASGGKIIANRTCKQDIVVGVFIGFPYI